MDPKEYVVAWAKSTDAFNHGDLEPFGELLADKCEFDATGGHAGSTREEILTAMKDGRDQGWTTHNILGVVAAGDFLATTYQNDYTDGSSVIAAGVVRFGANGKITEIRSLEPPDAG